MTKFDRITRDTQIMAGQAYIRGTGVSVYAITNLAAQGMSTADILTRYPMLEEEDILQALAYTVNELTHVIDQRHYGMKTWLTVIQSGCQILTDLDIFPAEESEPSADQAFVQEVIDEMFPQAIKRSLGELHQLYEWTSFYREPAPVEPDRWADDLRRLVKQALAYYVPRADAELVEVDIPDDLPPVYAARDMDRALGYLLLRLNPASTFPRRLKARQADDQTIRVRIYHDPTLGRSQVWALNGLGLARGNPQLASLFFPGSPFAIAALILHHYDCQLEARLTDEHVEISVSLPVWSGV